MFHLFPGRVFWEHDTANFPDLQTKGLTPASWNSIIIAIPIIGADGKNPSRPLPERKAVAESLLGDTEDGGPSRSPGPRRSGGSRHVTAWREAPFCPAQSGWYRGAFKKDLRPWAFGFGTEVFLLQGLRLQAETKVSRYLSKDGLTA